MTEPLSVIIIFKRGEAEIFFFTFKVTNDYPT